MLTCGGVSIFGDPKTDCWILGFDPDPFWSDGPKMNVARDSAAWALDDNFLFVFGGSLGKLNGYTDSVEMYHTVTGNWLEGTPMSSRGEFAAYSVLSVYLRFTSCHNKVFERVLEMPFFSKQHDLLASNALSRLDFANTVDIPTARSPSAMGASSSLVVMAVSTSQRDSTWSRVGGRNYPS